MTTGELQTRVAEVVRGSPECTWGVSIRPASGVLLVDHAAGAVLSTASVGKVLLLIEVARQFEQDPSLRGKLLDRRAVEPVADSGLWQHLEVTRLSMADLAVLTASMSDNWATNVLLHEVGLDAIQHRQALLGLEHTSLLDVVRDKRSDGDIDRLSVGTAGELSDLMARLGAGTVVSPEVSRTVLGWLSLNVDVSMVASAFDLDPLAHASGERFSVANKTGTDTDVRADIGHISGPVESVAYAVVANWDAGDSRASAAALRGMRAVGMAMRGHLASE